MTNNLTIFGSSVDKNLNKRLFNIEKQLSDLSITINAILNNSITIRTALTDTNNSSTITIPAGYSIDTASINVMANDGSFNLKMINNNNNETILDINITDTNDGIANINYINNDVSLPFNVVITLTSISGNNHRITLAISATKRT